MRPGDGVDDVQRTVAVHRRPVKELPLKQVSCAVSGHVGTLKRVGYEIIIVIIGHQIQMGFRQRKSYIIMIYISNP
jgi:hypothetical protein